MRKMAVWGTGNYARKLMEENFPLQWQIQYFIDNHLTTEQETYFGRPVVHPKDISWDEPPFMIVASAWYYEEIKKELETHGMQEWRDFIPSTLSARIAELMEMLLKAQKWYLLDKERLRRCYAEVLKELAAGKKRMLEILLEYGGKADGGRIMMKDGSVLSFYNFHDLSVISEEILFDEEYYFVPETETPVIFDGGANIGLSVYYFKKKFPDAKIIAFEPVQNLYDILQDNVRQNSWTNIVSYPYALSDCHEKQHFYIMESSLSGSLTKRNLDNGAERMAAEVEMDCVPIREYIQEPIDFMKLDLEGIEERVILNLAGKWDQIKCLFLEYHAGADTESNSLARILQVLEAEGFVYQIGKSLAFSKRTKFRPMRFIDSKISEIIWAKRL